MKVVVDYVAANPGCTKLDAGLAAGGHFGGNMAYVYGPVNRAIEAGLSDAEKRNGRYSLEVAS